jgi:hypothetical protein
MTDRGEIRVVPWPKAALRATGFKEIKMPTEDFDFSEKQRRIAP